MSLVRIPGIIAAAVGFHRTFTPPAGAPKVQERDKLTLPEKYIANQFTRVLLKTAVWCTALAECAIVIANRIPYLPMTQGMLRVALFQHGDQRQLAVSPMFLAGVTLIVSGAYLRDRCYKALGTLFTFERAIRQDHRLVTSGPYGVVRHPSYSGLGLVYLGIAMWHADRNSWLRQSSVLDTSVGRALVGSLAILLALGSIPMLGRIPKEDATLRKEFGEDWERWARRVPYSLIPGIY
ncbi:hypothetical protein BD779DRAFT_1670996 [Infundibulicybe gibba]|nr:hypothetical protein BD779DRAFT_1670996 [Infundibulicybe gibba]